jgi:phosphoribosylformylglycinamidine synthase I
MQPRALLLRTAGTNCELELGHAFRCAGAEVDFVHLDALIAGPSLIDDYQIIGFPGGFSYGDDIAAGRIFGLKLRRHLYGPLTAAVQRGVPIIGICNGFQILVQSGLLPGPQPGQPWPADPAPPTLALVDNVRGEFIDAWIPVRCNPESPCIWTGDVAAAPDAMMLPIAHAEGRFVAADEDIERLERNGQIALRYTAAPNGSVADIAGVCDVSGLVFGLMPHPERYVAHTQHPYAGHLGRNARAGDPIGLQMIRRAVEHASAQLV